jgi:hypothetical protein
MSDCPNKYIYLYFATYLVCNAYAKANGILSYDDFVISLDTYKSHNQYAKPTFTSLIECFELLLHSQTPLLSPNHFCPDKLIQRIDINTGARWRDPYVGFESDLDEDEDEDEDRDNDDANDNIDVEGEF